MKSKKYTRKLLFIVFILILSIIFIIFSIDKMTPEDKTVTRMAVIQMRILKYIDINDKLPENLKNLQELPNVSDNKIIDGWGNEIIYEYKEENGMVYLISLGQNDSENYIIRCFHFKNQDGTWSKSMNIFSECGNLDSLLKK